MLTPRTAVPEGSLIGIPGRFWLSVSNVVKLFSARKNLIMILFPVSGSNQGSNLTLKGWPLTVSSLSILFFFSWLVTLFC